MQPNKMTKHGAPKDGGNRPSMAQSMKAMMTTTMMMMIPTTTTTDNDMYEKVF
jgi:hypothetical protein